ncbi:unnamed protein product [Vicia faba]|uniref:Uncharacterized protein n=1 Tax=Vicia faba TaxID=3906 RepID=A0AAV1AXV3_VICFA|nr:unnamed protein product [Vicia faba]
MMRKLEKSVLLLRETKNSLWLLQIDVDVMCEELLLLRFRHRDLRGDKDDELVEKFKENSKEVAENLRLMKQAAFTGDFEMMMMLLLVVEEVLQRAEMKDDH